MSGAIVIDTNILVRATLSEKGRADAILEKISKENWKLFYGHAQLDEYVGVLKYKRINKRYKINFLLAEELVVWMIEYGTEIDFEKTDLCRDPDDNYILGLAVRAAQKKKTYLVTSDKDLLELKHNLKSLEILSPGEFLKK